MGTTTIATVMRRCVPVFEAGVAATALRIREKSASGGRISDSNRGRIPRFGMVILLPSGCPESGPELLVGAMGTLPYGRRSRSEHLGRRLGAESLLFEKNVRDSVLLRHPGELRRHDLGEVVGENLA